MKDQAKLHDTLFQDDIGIGGTLSNVASQIRR